jgi:hypothetical protein
MSLDLQASMEAITIIHAATISSSADHVERRSVHGEIDRAKDA